MHAALDLEALIGTENTGKLVTLIDASYTVHMNMRSYYGAEMTFGISVFSSMSKI